MNYSIRQVATGTDGCKVESRLRIPCVTGTSGKDSGGIKAEFKPDRENAGTPENTGIYAIASGKTEDGLLAELADAVDSKSTARKGISVRLR